MERKKGLQQNYIIIIYFLWLRDLKSLLCDCERASETVTARKAENERAMGARFLKFVATICEDVLNGIDRIIEYLLNSLMNVCVMCIHEASRKREKNFLIFFPGSK